MRITINLIALSATVLLLSSTACIRTYTDVTPEGTVTTRETYPQWQTVRRKQDIALPLPVRQRFEAYYRAEGHWPYSMRAFLEADSENRVQIEGLYRSGFTLIDIVRATADSLPVEFEFRTRTNLFFSRSNDGIDVGRDVHGRFLFVHQPNGSITLQQIIDKKR